MFQCRPIVNVVHGKEGSDECIEAGKFVGKQQVTAATEVATISTTRLHDGHDALVSRATFHPGIK
jgi:hypothetical protein